MGDRRTLRTGAGRLARPQKALHHHARDSRRASGATPAPAHRALQPTAVLGHDQCRRDVPMAASGAHCGRRHGQRLRVSDERLIGLVIEHGSPLSIDETWRALLDLISTGFACRSFSVLVERGVLVAADFGAPPANADPCHFPTASHDPSALDHQRPTGFSASQMGLATGP